MDEKQMLLMAAKAAGAASTQEARGGGLFVQWSPNLRGYRLWDPLADDGDALRLAVRLRLDIEMADDVIVAWYEIFGSGRIRYGDDPAAATRLAIVRAAAAIGGQST